MESGWSSFLPGECPVAAKNAANNIVRNDPAE
jgi:hypothetical protein